MTASTTGSQSSASVGRDAVDDHHQRRTGSEARANATSRSARAASGISIRSKRHVEDDRRARVDRAHRVDDAIITSWNGTTAHAMHQPGRLAAAVEHEGHEQQVDADERERVEQPLDELPAAAPVARAQIAARERDEDVPVVAAATLRCRPARRERGRGSSTFRSQNGISGVHAPSCSARASWSATRPRVERTGCRRPTPNVTVCSVTTSATPVNATSNPAAEVATRSRSPALPCG